MTVLLSQFAGAGQQFFTNAGVPLAGGLIYSYGAGGTTPLATYTTKAGNIQHSNPIQLDAAGRVPGGGEIWLTSNLAYKFLIKDFGGATIQTLDNLGASVDGATLGSSTGASLVGFIQAGAGAVLRTAQSKMREIVSVKDFGAVGDGVVDDTLALSNTFDFVKTIGGTMYLPSGTYLVSGGFGTDPSDPSDFANNVTILGDGATILVNFNALTSSIRVITIEGNNVEIRGITFNSTRVFDLYNTDPAVYRTIQIIGIEIGGKAASYNGIPDNLSYYKTGAVVENCSFNNINAPIIMTQTSYGRIINNDLYAWTQTGIVVWGCPSDIVVQNNRAVLGADDCVFLYNPKASQSAWVTAGNYSGGHRVINNNLQFTRAKFVGTGGYSDILIADNNCDLSHTQGMAIEADPNVFANGALYNKNIKISRNNINRAGRFYNTTSGYVYWQGPVAGENMGISMFRSPASRATDVLPYNIIIEENIVNNPDGNGIEVGYADAIQIQGNVILTGVNEQGSGPVGTLGYAIRTSDVHDVLINSNRIFENGATWVRTYLIENVNLISGDIHIKRNNVIGGETWQGAVDPASGLLDYDSTQSTASYVYGKTSPGGATNSLLATWQFWGETPVAQLYRAIWGSPNAAQTGLLIRNDLTTTRSINAAGTINASGTDYAEYMTKAGEFTIAKGDICGIDSDGKLTNIFDDSVTFVVKSTNPSYVGGDTWGYIPDWDGKSELTEDQKSQLEQKRKLVDRIAFSGRVPVNVIGASPGDFIVPVNNNGIIGSASVSNPTFDQYKISVGKVIAIEQDGRPLIIVKTA